MYSVYCVVNVDVVERTRLFLFQLLSIISSDQLNVSKEENVYTAVMDWVKHNTNDRQQHVPKVDNFAAHLCELLKQI